MNVIKNSTFQTPIEVALGVDENGMTTARRLYEFLELRPDNFSRWCKTNITQNEFATENEDYLRVVFDDETPTGGKVQREDYKLTAHFAKKLSVKGNSAKAEQAREYFTILEEKAKQKIIDLSQLSPQMQLMNMLVQSMSKQELEQKRQAEQLNLLKDNIRELKSKITTHNEDYYTIAGYASLRGLNVDISKANMLGRKASQLSKTYGYDIGKIKGPRFGTVNTYHIDILKDIFVKRS